MPWARSHGRTQGRHELIEHSSRSFKDGDRDCLTRASRSVFRLPPKAVRHVPKLAGGASRTAKRASLERERSASPETNVQRNDGRRWRGVRGRSEFVDLGRSATSSPAMASNRRPKAGSPGNAAISRESRAVAKSPDICARSIASCHGSRPDRPSAEITLSNCPCRSSPMDAKRNGSNSRPMRGANAA